MNQRWELVGFACSAVLLSACTLSAPVPRLDTYLGGVTVPPERPAEACAVRDVGVLVVHDTSGEGSLPPQSAEGLQSLSVRIKTLAERTLPIHVVKIAAPVAGADAVHRVSWKGVGQEQNVDALLLAVVSVAEVTGSDQFPLDGTQDGGGAMGVVPGRLTSDYALVEVGLLDVKADRLLVRAQGRGSATLEQLASGLTSNAYPVIRQPGNTRRMFPPREGAQPASTLAVVAIEQALGQAMDNLKGCPGP